MPSDFPRSPRMVKGALVVFESLAPIPTNLIVFQYNPETMSRGFQQSGSGDPREGGGDTRNLQQPIETFDVSIELDAADQLELPGQNPIAQVAGLHPTLAALELLITPPSTSLILNKVLSLAGTSLISPASVPLVLFVWGPLRVVPVFVTSISIEEQAFDQLLNPILAKVSLQMRGLTDPELRRLGPPFETLGIVNQIAKEVLARSNIFNSVQQLGGGGISF